MLAAAGTIRCLQAQLASEATLHAWRGRAAGDSSMTKLDAAVMLLELVSLLQ